GRDEAREKGGGPAGGERHHEADGRAGEGLLREGGRAERREREKQHRHDTADPMHGYPPVVLAHCTASPTSRASGAQNAYSSATNLATAAGSRSRVESASWSICARIFGVLLMRRISALSLPTMSVGKLLGPASQNQVSPRTSG